MCYEPAAPCWISILNIAVCTCLYMFGLPNYPLPPATISSFSKSVCESLSKMSAFKGISHLFGSSGFYIWFQIPRLPLHSPGSLELPPPPLPCSLRPNYISRIDEPHPSAEKWIKDLLSMASLTRGRSNFHHSQSLSLGSFHSLLLSSIKGQTE